MLGDVTARLSLETAGDEARIRFWPSARSRRRALIIISADRGLAGGFNSNLARRLERFLVDEKERYPERRAGHRRAQGARALEAAPRRQQLAVRARANRRRVRGGDLGQARIERARELAKQATDDYLDGKIDAVLVAFNEFKSAIAQVVQIEHACCRSSRPSCPSGATRFDFEYEPSKGEVLSTLVPLYIEITLFRAMLESIASFFGAQMSAMDNATKNAKEMIGNLTLQFNRARQAAITKELMEIVGGAEALKG